MQKYHHDLLVEAEQQGPKIAQQPLFKDKWSTSKCLKFKDREPLALLERKGFRESAQEQMVWATVKDMAIQHWKFEEEEQSESQADGAIMSPPHKLARTGMGLLMSLYTTQVEREEVLMLL